VPTPTGYLASPKLQITFGRADVVSVFPASLTHPGTDGSEHVPYFAAVKLSGVMRVIGVAGSSGALPIASGRRMVRRCAVAVLVLAALSC
jgi:hypothetical protein